MEIRISVPEKAAYILDELIKNGYEAYVVGGCVRDFILGKTPGDWDITTSASPQEVKRLFHRTIDTGIQHGTVTVMLGNEGFEVTTYRLDGEYDDCRHPREVVFTRDLREDLKRRDFTINAMAYNGQRGLVDIFDGRGDLVRKQIKCVGDARQRFDEDALRMLRAVRFSGQLGFSIDADTKAAMKEKAESIGNISAERIHAELDKLLRSSHPDHLRYAWEAGLTSVILPEFDQMMMTEQHNRHHCYNVGEHTLHALMELCSFYKNSEFPRSIDQTGEKLYSVLAWTLLFHDCGKTLCKTRDNDGEDHFQGHAKASAKIARMAFKRLKFDNYTINFACSLIHWHDFRFTGDEAEIRRLASCIGPDKMDALFLIERMDIMAQNPDTWEEKLAMLDAAEKAYQLIRERGDCLTMRQLEVNGRDLMMAGMQKGPEIGSTLSYLLQEVLAHPEKNCRETLLSMVFTR